MRSSTKEHLNTFLKRYKELGFLEKEIIKAVETIVAAAKKGRQVLVCGNGGSAADSEHMAGEFLKGFVLKRELLPAEKKVFCDRFGDEGTQIADSLQRGIRCIPLTSFTAFNTAFANDARPEMVFAQLVNVLGAEGDVLVAFSTSGNSPSVLYAAMAARAKHITTISLTGQGGGKLKAHSDILLNAPSQITYQIQEYHLPLYHVICLMVESECF